MADSRSRTTRGGRTLVPIYAVGVLMCLLVSASVYYGNRMSSRHAPLVDAAMEIKLEAATAHLWFEEILSGDRHESMDTVWAHLNQADWYAKAMLEGGQNPEGIIQPLHAPELRREIMQAREKIADFQRVTKERLAARSGAGAGTDVDQRYDAMFHDFMARADAVETRLQAVMAKELGQFNAVQIALLILVCAATVTAGLLLHRNQRRWQAHARELKGARAAVRGSEARLRTLIDTIPDPVWLKDPDGVYLACNAAFEHLVGARQAEILGKTDRDFIDAELADSFRANDQAAIDAGGPRHNEEWVSFADDGHRALLDTTKTPVPGADGAPIGVLGIGHDITELRESRDQLKQAVEAGNVGLWDWDLATDQVYYSPEWKRQIGYRDDELGSAFTEWRSRVHPDDLQATEQRIRACIETPLHEYEAEFRFRHRDGSYRWILARASLIRDEAGQPRRMLGAHVDISKRKQAEEALQRNEERFRSFFEQAPLAYQALDENGSLLAANAAWRETLGYQSDEVLGKSFADFLADGYQEHFRKNFPRFKAAGEIHAVQFQMLRKDNQPIDVEFEGKIARDSTGKFLQTHCLLTDITQRKRAEAKLREQLDELRRWHDATLGREGRVLELKHEINVLLAELGRQPRYPSAEQGVDPRENGAPGETRAKRSG